MSRHLKLPCLIIATTAFVISCVSQDEMKIDRLQLIARLEQEMANNVQFLRVHAAEGLLDNGQSDNIAELFRREAITASAPYRIAVWRVLTRCTDGEEQAGYLDHIREAMRDPDVTNRITAAESLAKLNAANHADREFILEWLKTADDATAVFPQWLLVLCSNRPERAENEARLATLLRSADPVARLRAAFALGRLKDPSNDSVANLREQLKIEPRDSVARVYFITALLLHTSDPNEITALEQQLTAYRKGAANEQLEVGLATGLLGRREGLEILKPMLDDPEPDARIGAANGMLKLLR